MVVEIVKALVGPIATAILAWVIGNRLSAKWTMRQKRRDDARESANQFYRLYGEFFATWKLWNYAHKLGGTTAETERRWELLKRAAAAEAGIEAFLVKVTSERSLEAADVEALGRFRQGYQTLRQAIRDDRPIGWHSSEHQEYAAFKRLASHAGRLVSTIDADETPAVGSAQRALREVTANAWEGHWYLGTDS